MKETATQAIHSQALLKDFGEDEVTPTIVHTHNKVARDRVFSGNFSKRPKHVTIAREWVKGQLESGIIHVKHVRTHQ